MPWQQNVFDVALEREHGRLVYRDIVITVPRQSGKTTLLLVLILLRALGDSQQVIRYTAQTGSDARKKWNDDWLPILEHSPFGNLFKPRLTNGHEALIFKNGSIQTLIATTKKTGHGGTIDLGILDEAFAHPDARLEQALKPSMMTRPQPQLWVVSTAGTPDDSPYLLSKVSTGRELAEAGSNEGTAYFEWSASDDMDPEDRATWYSCMPALGLTTPESAVAADLKQFVAEGNLNEFERAYLNRWKSALSDPVIPIHSWLALTDVKSQVLDPVSFAFDVSPDSVSGSIALAGRRSDGLIHLEIVDHQPGIEWLPRKVAELSKRHRGSKVFCDPASAAGPLLPDLMRLGVEVQTLSGTEHAQACGMLYNAVVDTKTVRHLGTPEMLTAIDGGVRRSLGDAWAWSRKNSNVDISPLVATTIAHWAASSIRDSTTRFISLADALANADK